MHNAQSWSYPLHHPDGDGPWADEPDKVQWVDEATDLDCLAVRGPIGAWCGYVGVPPGHPWHGRDYDDIDTYVEVHGGLTFAHSCDEREEDGGPRICHVPLPGRTDDVWWLGFDCSHAGDYIPGVKRHPIPDIPLFKQHAFETYRTVGYVRDECTNLARQVAAAKVAA